MMGVAEDPESTLEERLLAIPVYCDPRPSGLGPIVPARLLDKGTTLVHAVRGSRDLLHLSSLAVGTEICHSEVVMENVVVRFKDEANGRLTRVESECEIEVGERVDAVGGRLDDGIVNEGDVFDGISFYRVR